MEDSHHSRLCALWKEVSQVEKVNQEKQSVGPSFSRSYYTPHHGT